MRVALLSNNAEARNAIGNQMAEKVAFFLERGARVRVLLESLKRLHPELLACAEQVSHVSAHGPVWDYLTNADLVIADYAQHYELLHFLPLLVGTKPRLILDYHGVTPAHHWAGAQRTLLERSARQRGLVWCADAALAHSQFAKAELRDATGYPVERIAVLPYPTDRTLFCPGPSEDLRHRYGLGAGPVLLYVGRLAASKRVRLLIETLALMPDAHALIVGDRQDVYGIEAQRCQELAERLSVAQRVHFVGQVADAELPNFYSGADVLVIPSLHEGYCLPAVEAMACGLPVVAARTTALPETIGPAGLTFAPDDAQDLARQLKRVIGVDKEMAAIRVSNAPRRVAIVAFRFGRGVIGGAETSLRKIAQTLQRDGQVVEIFTTCTVHECDWTNDVPSGTSIESHLTVHRFPIDPHDRAAHHQSIRQITEANGNVDCATEDAYLRHSIHSTPLIEALRQREAEFDAIITGPYLFGLTHDVARAFPEKTLLVPCFHDEPFARLRCWRQAYTAVGGMLYHSPEEQQFAEVVLGFNHPRGTELGTVIDLQPGARNAVRGLSGPYVVYCGRYSRQKNLPLLLNYAERYDRERPGRFQFVFLGQGEVPIPRAAWAKDWGRVDEEAKRQVLAHAAMLVQLSRQESLSLVALEAWAQGTPVLVHKDCAVLRGQVQRAQGGQTIESYDDFAQAFDDLWARPDAWRELGANGRNYVVAHYGSDDAFRQRLYATIDGLHIPLRDCMRQRGLQRAMERDRPRWRERFGQFIERCLDDAPTAALWDIEVQSRQMSCRATAGNRSTLAPVRVVNHGSLPALADGPAKTELVAHVVDLETGKPIGTPQRTPLPALLVPGQAQPAALAVALPGTPGNYQLVLGAESNLGKSSRQTMLPLVIDAEGPTSALGLFESVQASLADLQRLQQLPDDYLDVTEGRFARCKRWLKQKLLGNFKKSYVDVLSRQQSQVNQHLLAAVQQLAEYCATLEHALKNLQQQRGLTDAAETVFNDSCEIGSPDRRVAAQSREDLP